MADITITQEELDNRIAVATQEAVTAATARFADYEALQASATRLQELERSNEDAVQRQIREAREAAQAEVPTLVSAATEGARSSVIEAEIRSYAVQHNFSYPDDVVAKLAGNAKITVDDKFKVRGVEALVKELAASRPEWLKRPAFSGAPPRSSGPGGGDITPEERQAQIQQAIRERRLAIGVGAGSI